LLLGYQPQTRTNGTKFFTISPAFPVKLKAAYFMQR
jgi:hypothetical protein